LPFAALPFFAPGVKHLLASCVLTSVADGVSTPSEVPMRRSSNNRVLWLSLFLVAALPFACTPQYRGSGALLATPLYRPDAIPIYLGVDEPHFFAHGGDANVDFDMEAQQDGCARGSVNGYPVEACPAAGEQDKSGSVKTWRFNGPLGTRTFTTESQGDRVYVDFGISQGRAQFVVPSGFLQQHPELVGAAFFAGAFGLPRPGSELQAWLIRPKEAR
jgi:hypothetical protein